MKRAAFYARVSSDLQQKEGTIESQIVELKKQIEKTGDELVKEYIDDGHSGALLDRPGMNQLRDDLKKDWFDVIYILNTDRIARDVTYQNIIVGEMLRHKKQLIINGRDYVENPENKFTLTVLGAVSELERAKLIERVTRGRQYRLKQGILMGNGHHLYGYTYTKKTPTSWPSYAINEEEAKVVRYVFETYTKTQVGIRPIARQLEKMGVVRGRNKLKQSNLKWMLRNETYTGVRYFNTMKEARVPQDPLSGTKRSRREYTDRSEWVGIPVPAIISKETFDKARVRLDHNLACYRNSRRTQLFSGFVWCGKCGSRCYSYHRTHQYKRGVFLRKKYDRFVYKCNAKEVASHNQEINGHILESCVWDMIKGVMPDPTRLAECIDALKKRKNVDLSKVEKQLVKLGERKYQITQNKKRIVDLYAQGNLEHEEYLRRTRTYDKELTSLESQRAELSKYAPMFQSAHAIQDSVAEYCKGVEERLQQCVDFETKRAFIFDFITKISYQRPNKARTVVEVCGQIPAQVALPGSTISETVRVPFKIKYVMNWHEFMERLPNGDETWSPVLSAHNNPIGSVV